ncbi:hypothetical protein F5I97DRAFT_1808238 [Phlebopus sp. FC_14]|nr:hypothetical protein F5I97DRAFT_1808238 [Phlebopus sp. FC_14]
MAITLSPLSFFFRLLYVFLQRVMIAAFKPKPPPEKIQRPYARIAVIGAGLTGTSSAAHAVSHGFEVVIYEATDRTGGIWTHENETSSLQINSLLYRFHPAVFWTEAFPRKNEILSEIDRIWKEYRLQERTRFNTPVKNVRRVKRAVGDEAAQAHVRSPSQWYINDGEDGPFDAVIVTIGTCGDPYWGDFQGMPAHAGKLGDLGTALKRNEQGRFGVTAVYDSDPAKAIHSAENKSRSRKKVSKYSKGDQQGGRHSAPLSGNSHAKRPGSPEGKNETYQGPIIHSSQLDCATCELLRDKTVVVIGGGASAVEAVGTALSRGAARCVVMAREDKWIIPRNVIFDTFLAAQPFGREMPFSFLWERFLSAWQYHGVEELVPTKGIFTGTPVVNDEFIDHVRAGRCIYVRGDVLRLSRGGVVMNVRERIERGVPLRPAEEIREKDTKEAETSTAESTSEASTDEPVQAKEGATETGQESCLLESHVEEFNADMIVLATGYKRPDIGFLPGELFPEDYDRPNLYLQNFCTEDWSVLMTNSAYQNAIGTVGHFHIGIYTRILLTLLLDPSTRPTNRDMKLWVDVIRYIKRGASGGALSFFTYMELLIWLFLFHIFRPDRLRWYVVLPFIMLGWGVRPDKEWLLSLCDQK